ncbi:ANTAR domain-containing response regulator [Parachitinimonas caeni]|uniref:ANTAR domain-containing protein n=1 Tax=Parachitinimonas caeni TaxID=3031301 RepID=A0ABT7DXC3_9NEIS|nr:ANTAR domain-containing protein [Parachitinimonas caeni]MDK2124716.1 ANTAR domain-containing protein [Parachitinimonas caeni]
MLKVVLICDGSGRTALLAEALAGCGITLLAQLGPSPALAAQVQQLAPDVVLIDNDAPARDTLESICIASRASERPVVMLTADGRRDTIRQALAAGVAAYVVGEVPHDRMETLLWVAIERFALERERQQELATARQRLADRQWVDKAKGLLMQLRGLDEDAAYRLLRERAMQAQRRIGDVAREMVEVAGWLGKPGGPEVGPPAE